MGKVILVFAYAISPTKGSEYAVGWNFINNIAKNNFVHVICGTSGEHLGDVEEIEKYEQHSWSPNVRLTIIRPSRLVRLVNKANQFGFTYAFYIAFRLWNKQACRTAQEIIALENIDIVHYLNPIGYREPGYVGQLGVPVVWGPIGGTRNRNLALMRNMKAMTQAKFLLKNIINWVQFRYSARIRKAFKRADALIAATLDDAANIMTVHKRDCWHLPESGLFDWAGQVEKPNNLEKEIRVVWSGRHDENKNLILLLKAVKKISNKKHLKIDILGSGPETARLKTYVREHELSSYITWHGHVSRYECMKVLAKAHVHVMTSLNEANSTVLFEAMSFAVPTISLAHCGMKDIICDRCGILISATDHHEAVLHLARELEALILDPEKLKLLSTGVQECSREHQWGNRTKKLEEVYDVAIRNFQTKINNK